MPAEEKGENKTMKREMLQEEQIRELIRLAIGQLAFSYSPYSHFKVGAALLCADGKIYTGCNIENAAFIPGDCAERTAFCKAVSEGEKTFRAICIVGGKEGVLAGQTAPCGVCRQVMMEFCDPDDFEIILPTDETHYQIYTLKQLLPLGFGPANLS